MASSTVIVFASGTSDQAAGQLPCSVQLVQAESIPAGLVVGLTDLAHGAPAAGPHGETLVSGPSTPANQHFRHTVPLL